MTNNRHSAFVSKQASLAARNIGHNNDVNKRRLADAGAIEALTAALLLHEKELKELWDWFGIAKLEDVEEGHIRDDTSHTSKDSHGKYKKQAVKPTKGKSSTGGKDHSPIKAPPNSRTQSPSQEVKRQEIFSPPSSSHSATSKAKGQGRNNIDSFDKAPNTSSLRRERQESYDSLKTINEESKISSGSPKRQGKDSLEKSAPVRVNASEKKRKKIISVTDTLLANV